MTAAQVCDWLKEHYEEAHAERTVSRYVKELREEYRLPRHPNPRSYETVAELPMGQQMQVDCGQTTLKNVEGGWTTVHVAAFLLSHSRYKYAQCQSRPFTAADLVAACHNCFRYWGGMPREMVFDQDSIVCVSENSGDIVYTYEFEKFRQNCKVEIYLCRGADPESKGMMFVLSPFMMVWTVPRVTMISHLSVICSMTSMPKIPVKKCALSCERKVTAESIWAARPTDTATIRRTSITGSSMKKQLLLSGGFSI